MKKVLVIGDGKGRELLASNLSTVRAGCEMSGGGVDMCVLGSDVESLAREATRIEGVEKVWLVEDEKLEHSFAEIESPVIMSLMERGGYDGVAVAASSYGKNLLPRLGALLDVQPISDITGVLGEGVYERPIYAGNALLQVRMKDSVHLVSVRSTAFEDAVLLDEGKADVEKVDLEIRDYGGRIAFEGVDFSSHDRPELTTAKVVISGGRGMASGENFVLLERVAEHLNAAIGASRAAVDAGFVSNDLQVGQTGKVVAPDLYIAVGISGAIQHLAGMKDSKVIVAINNDEEAPIFQVADYGLVGDLFEVLPELEQRLK